MTNTFAELKRNRTSALEEIAEQIKKTSDKQSFEDNRFWQPTIDKAGNGYAIIRFLPPVAGEAIPFVRVFRHSFKGPTGQWYIENSLTTLKLDDPVSEYNSELWAKSDDDDSPSRKQARNQKRKLQYISNIYVVKDEGNPANEGKVFLYKYGKKIFDKINESTTPQFADETPLNPFDLWEGANFKLKIRTVEGYLNYDKSEFDTASPLDKNDDALEQIWKSEHPLQPFLAPSEFKDYDTLKKKLYAVLGISGKASPRIAEKHEDEDGEVPWNEPKAKAEPKLKAKPAPATLAESDEEDEELSYFKRLSEQ